jgi:integrase/recombinase XerD
MVRGGGARQDGVPFFALMNVMQISEQAIDGFTSALWLEDGLAANTLAAYRRDLVLFSRWLTDKQGSSRNSV